MSPLEAAVDLVRVYAERGDDVDHFKKGYLGSYCERYSAQIGGYMWPIEYVKGYVSLEKVEGKKIPNTKILVKEVNGEAVNELFSLYKVWNYILEEKKQTTLF